MSPEPPERILSLRVDARPDQLRGVRKAVRECVVRCGVDEACAADVVMAVDEACQNIIRHAYRGEPGGSILVEVHRDGGALVFSLHDEAPTIDPSKVKPRDLEAVRPGGLGTHLMKEVMDEVRFIQPPSGRGNLLKMVKRIA
jgi:sigma-B regulation protein RsbU (phosphoserine phosphatase)